jgi:DNA-directed RNA polymerase subunit RPC12/RpoP
MLFPCPGCQAPVEAHLSSWLIRCDRCGARIASRRVEAGDGLRTYEVRVVGRPETAQRVTAPWTADDEKRLKAWLIGSTVLTLGLAVLLLLAALVVVD